MVETCVAGPFEGRRPAECDEYMDMRLCVPAMVVGRVSTRTDAAEAAMSRSFNNLVRVDLIEDLALKSR